MQRVETLLGIEERRLDLRAYPFLLAHALSRLIEKRARSLEPALNRFQRVVLRGMQRLADRVKLGEIILAALTCAAGDVAVARIRIIRR